MPTSPIIIHANLDGIPEKPDQITQRELDRLRVRNFAQDIRLRKKFANATFALVVGWLCFVAIYLLLPCTETAVLVALVTGSTIKVLGLYYIVLRYLFPNNG